ncbi:MAG: hypothetical protein WCD38_07100, partial [Candidatus Tumulicola sp.]
MERAKRVGPNGRRMRRTEPRPDGEDERNGSGCGKRAKQFATEKRTARVAECSECARGGSGEQGALSDAGWPLREPQPIDGCEQR